MELLCWRLFTSSKLCFVLDGATRQGVAIQVIVVQYAHTQNKKKTTWAVELLNSSYTCAQMRVQ